MKTFFSEYTSNYQTYTFGYTQYAVLESSAELDHTYMQGFLPYSNDLTLTENIFYRCRSLRVNCAEFEFNSENRRVARKAAEHTITRKLYTKSEFDSTNPSFEQFCLNYAHTRYGADNMPLERLRYILSRNYANYIMEYKIGDNILGYVYFIMGKQFIHYWFSYFDVTYMEQFPVGTYMMADMIAWSKEQGLSYTYLGTCYKESGLYKVRNFDAIQRWNGNQRSNDVVTLKHLCKTDTETKTQDQFKENPSHYLS